MSEFFDHLSENLRDAFWTGVGKKSEEPPSKKPKWWLVLCARLTFLAILWATAGELLPWLRTTIKEHPLEISFVLLVAISTLFLEMWFHWMRDANFAWREALKFEQLNRETDARLRAQEVKCADLEAENTRLRGPLDTLSPPQRRILTCILCAGKITLPKICAESGYLDHQVREVMHALRYDRSLVRRCGTSAEDGQELFELTDGGKQYAVEQRIPAIDQADQEIQQTSANAEKQALKEQNQLLFKENEFVRAKCDQLATENTGLRALITNGVAGAAGGNAPIPVMAVRPTGSRQRSAAAPVTGVSAASTAGIVMGVSPPEKKP